MLRLLIVATLVLSTAAAAEPLRVSATLQTGSPGPRINRAIYGQFAEHLGHCIYGGIWVGEASSIPNTRGIRNDVLAALRQLQVPVLRWPGGCFADEYHWRDGIGPRDKRPSMINTNWGGVVENNHFGTHEFFDLCELIGAEPYVCGNLGSGTVQEMMEWVEYMTSDADSPLANLRRKNGRERPWKLPYFGVGNENWGCGGNMRPEYYADNYRRYSTYVKNYPGQKIYRVAGGASSDDYRWTEVLMQTSAKHMDGLSLHHYTLPTGSWSKKGSPTEFNETEYHATLQRANAMENLLALHSEIMDRYDPERRVGLVVDEWGIWTDPDPGTNPGFLRQQNSLRDAFVAALHLHAFHRHAARVTMANIAQMVNVLQAMILTDGDRMLLTPTYHVFEMYKVHQNARVLPLNVETAGYTRGTETVPALSATASVDDRGVVHLGFVNVDPNNPAVVSCRVEGRLGGTAAGRVLTAPTVQAHNTFASPRQVAPAPFRDFTVSENGLSVTLPPRSVVVLSFAPIGRE